MAADTKVKQTEVRAATQIDPRKILLNKDRNISRFNKNRETMKDVHDLAYDMSLKGNLEPIKVRRVNRPDFEFESVAGFGRHSAAMLIVDGFDYTTPDGETVRVHEPEFKIKISLVTGNDDAMDEICIRENTFKKGLSPMDKAVIAHRMKEVKGKSTKEIARVLNCDPTYVSQILRLLELPSDIQGLLDDEERTAVPLRVAMKITEFPDDEKEAFYAMIRAGNSPTIAILNKRTQELQAESVPDDPEDGSEPTEGAAETPAPRLPRMNWKHAQAMVYWKEKNGVAELPPIAAYASYMVTKRLPGKSKDENHDKQLEKMVKGGAQMLLDYCKGNNIKDIASIDLNTVWKEIARSSTGHETVETEPKEKPKSKGKK